MGNRVGGRAQRMRMGTWKARVEKRTSRRKNRYWRSRGWDWRTAALVVVFCAEGRAS